MSNNLKTKSISITLTGRSGINLDGSGNKNSCFWLYDGVSPIIFSKKEKWLFREFFRDKKKLDLSLNNASQSGENLFDILRNTQKIYQESKKTNTNSKFKPHTRPLYSLAIVKIKTEKKSGTIEYAIYGDCGILIEIDANRETLINTHLEKTKTIINKFVNIMDEIRISIRTKNAIKLSIFSAIRYLQCAFGFLPVFGSKLFSSQTNQENENFTPQRQLYYLVTEHLLQLSAGKWTQRTFSIRQMNLS